MKIARVILICGVLLASSIALAQESIQLRATVLSDTLDAMTLGDIATIDGPSAASLAKITIPEGAWTHGTVGTRTLDVSVLRKLLGETQGVNLGRVALSGSRVEWRQKAIEPPPAPVAQPASAADAPAGHRVRDLLQHRLATALSVTPSDLRVSLDEGDADILNTSVEGRTVTITPMGESDRPPLAIRVYEGDTLVAARSTRVGVLLRRQVVLAARDIRRGELLDPSLLMSEERWLAPSVAAATLDEAMGKSARGAIEAGAIITRRDAEEPIVVRKGERIVVDCMAHGVLVRSTMRASAQARIGDVIAVEPLASERSTRRGEIAPKPGAVFARVSGPGKAVVTTSQPTTRAADSDELLERVNRPAPRSQDAKNPTTQGRPTQPALTDVDTPTPFTIRRGGVEVTSVSGSPTGPRKDQP